MSGATFASPAGSAVPAGFLGALIAGFAAGYLMLGMRKLCDKLPRSLEGLKPILIYPVVGLLVIGLFMCLINPFVGMLNSALYSGLQAMGEGSKVLLGIVLAAMMAIDMGGPFNKAAYVFGTSTLATVAAGQGSEDVYKRQVQACLPLLSRRSPGHSSGCESRRWYKCPPKGCPRHPPAGTASEADCPAG